MAAPWCVRPWSGCATSPGPAGSSGFTSRRRIVWRKYAWQVLLVEELQRAGVELVFLNRTIGVSPEEDLLLQMQGMIAEYERAKIMERSRRGKRHAARRGSVNVLGGAPYGYRYLRKHDAGGQAQYQVVLDQARVVKRIFEWVGRDRLSLRDVCRRLRRQGVLSPKGKPFWDAQTVGKLLKNPAYKGAAVFGRTRMGERRPRLRPLRGRPEQPRQAHSRYPGPPEDRVVIPVPALVSEELCEAAAEQVMENRKRYRRRVQGPGYLLARSARMCCGYAYYGKGGGRFAANPQAPYPYYRCIGADAFRFGGVRVCRNRPPPGPARRRRVGGRVRRAAEPRWPATRVRASPVRGERARPRPRAAPEADRRRTAQHQPLD